MSIRRMTFQAWGEALALTHGKPEYRQVMGSSPGGAGERLGLTRQRIWQLCKEGKLDMILLADNDEAKVSTWLITDASMDRVLKSKPMEQADLLFGKPKSTKGRRQHALAHARAARQR